MDRFTDEALVLSTVDYGDADRLVTLLTREHGKLTAFAAGARKSKRRFAGALEPFTHLRVQLVERHGSTVRLDGADIQSSFHRIREDLGRISRAMYAVELCRELCRDREPHSRLFELLGDQLQLLEENRAGPTSLIAFELTVLGEAGLQPRFDACAICGGGLGPGLKFDPEHGGAVCAQCGARAQSGVPTSVALIEALAELQAGARKPMPPAERARARELLNLFIAHQLGRKLKTVEFLAQLGLD